MDAKRCDFCRKFYEIDEDREIFFDIQDCLADRLLDLCPECQARFEDWVSKQMPDDEQDESKIEGEIPEVNRLSQNRVHVKAKGMQALIFDDEGESDEELRLQYFHRLNCPEQYVPEPAHILPIPGPKMGPEVANEVLPEKIDPKPAVEVTFTGQAPPMVEIEKNNKGKYHKRLNAHDPVNKEQHTRIVKHLMEQGVDAYHAKLRAYQVIKRCKEKGFDFEKYWQLFIKKKPYDKITKSKIEYTEVPYGHLRDQPKAWESRLIDDMSEKIMQDHPSLSRQPARSKARMLLIDAKRAGIDLVGYYKRFMKGEQESAEEPGHSQAKCAMGCGNTVHEEGGICDPCNKSMAGLNGGQNEI